MQEKDPIIFNTFGRLVRSKIVILIVALVLGTIGYFIFFRQSPTYQFVTVKRGSITETVSITGNTIPAQSVSLAFGSSGTISKTYSALGKKVYAGQILAELNINDLMAGLRQAEASVEIQEAKLAGLRAGARPEDIAASQAALDKAKQDLANMYGGILDSSLDSYAKASDAIQNQIDSFFSNDDSQSPELAFIIANFQAQNDAEAQRLSVTTALNEWQNKLKNIDQSNSGLELMLQNEISYLSTIRQLLNILSTTLDSSANLSATTLATYKTNLSVAINEVNTASKNLNTISQNIASQKLIVSQLESQLNLKKEGSLPSDISAQEAQVKQAKASVESARAKLQNARIVSPIGGTVTLFDAKVGQLASPSTPLVSIMSAGGYEIDSGVSETDVGKISLGNKVTMTLDAFPNETFAGSVFYIAPSETNTQGVVSYQIKISFDKQDLRLKSGLTANIDINTRSKDDVLILPQYAILQNDQGTFVETLENGVTKQNPVTLGLQDQKGNVEILSGVIEKQQVLNIGLKLE
jgi:HlyD family secretion protein